MRGANEHPEYRAAIEAWRRTTPWFRRASARIGLQGKLVLCFVGLVCLALGSSCWVFLSHSREMVTELGGQQATQIAYTLARAAKPALRGGDVESLERMGQELTRNNNVLAIAFLDADARPLAVASRDPDLRWRRIDFLDRRSQAFMKVYEAHSALFGPYLEVVAPVLGADLQEDAPVQESAAIVGYVLVGTSQAREQAQLDRISSLVLLIGCVVLALSLPMAYLLVRRIFLPIRQLVEATDRIAGGDLEARVAIDRPDVIGTLARSFNAMVRTVRKQQDDLAAANDKLADANRDLEQKVHQRTAQLEMANRRLSREIAEKEDFLRAVSHDLNAPLRNISGMASLLLLKHRDKFDEDIVHRLERIKKNVEVETDLIAELLELSRIKTRRHKMEMVDLNGLVDDLRDIFEDDLRQRSISLLIDAPLPVLHCERARMRQVFQNLIDNAIKYMGDGSLREIRLGCDTRATEAEFYVRDTGVGIEPDELDKVFYIFRRGKSQAVQGVSGKGVGLATVKSIVETYSGTVWVESHVGKGSTFRFTINGQYVPEAARRGKPLRAVQEAVNG